MCGIVAVVRRPSRPRAAVRRRARAASTERARRVARAERSAAALGRAADARRGVDRAAAGRARVAGAAGRPLVAGARSTASCGELDARRSRRSSDGSTTAAAAGRRRSRRSNAALVRLQGRGVGCAPRSAAHRRAPSVTSPGRDAGPRGDRGVHLGPAVALSALDRLEVRGPRLRRAPPAVRDHGLDLDAPGDRRAARRRSGTTRCSASGRCARRRHLSFVYKAAAEIGELGDNTRALRAADHERRAAAPGARRPTHARRPCSATPAGPASGIISQPNAHPLNSDEEGGGDDRARTSWRRSTATSTTIADLKAADGLRIAGRDHHRRQGDPDARVATESARASSRARRSARRSPSFEGSVAIAASAAADARRPSCSPCAAAARRSTSVSPRTRSSSPASPTGSSRRPTRYLRIDGETPADPANPTPAAARSFVLDGDARRHARGHRAAVATTAPRCPSTEDDVARAQITTRDIDRGDYPHFLLKEIVEAPASFRKTLRGKLVERRRPALARRLGAGHDPDDGRATGCATARSTRVIVIGQGTAAVAGQSLAARARASLRRRARRCASSAMPATELSGFGLRPDMSDTLVVAISQSGHDHRHEPHRRPRPRPRRAR